MSWAPVRSVGPTFRAKANSRGRIAWIAVAQWRLLEKGRETGSQSATTSLGNYMGSFAGVASLAGRRTMAALISYPNCAKDCATTTSGLHQSIEPMLLDDNGCRANKGSGASCLPGQPLMLQRLSRRQQLGQRGMKRMTSRDDGSSAES